MYNEDIYYYDTIKEILAKGVKNVSVFAPAREKDDFCRMFGFGFAHDILRHVH